MGAFARKSISKLWGGVLEEAQASKETEAKDGKDDEMTRTTSAISSK